ncbi:MAG: hypothetical protein KKB59_19640, partial [Spirochaetes bacterium]|nr:hypothetical protein [Spirochaetota bacterium]
KETDVDVSFITETIIEPTGKKNKIEPIHNSGGKSVMDWYTNKKMTNPNPGYQEPLANRNTVDEYMKKIGLKK